MGGRGHCNARRAEVARDALQSPRALRGDYRLFDSVRYRSQRLEKGPAEARSSTSRPRHRGEPDSPSPRRHARHAPRPSRPGPSPPRRKATVGAKRAQGGRARGGQAAGASSDACQSFRDSRALKTALVLGDQALTGPCRAALYNAHARRINAKTTKAARDVWATSGRFWAGSTFPCISRRRPSFF